MNLPPGWKVIPGRERAYPILGIIAATVSGAGIARFSSMALAGVVAITLGLLCLSLVRKETLLTFALAGCGTLIAFPAFLPRPGADSESAALGGDVDGRGLAQLAIIVAVIAIGLWMLLVSDSGMSVFFRSPMPLLLCYVLLVVVSLLYAPDLAWSTFGLLKLLSILVLLAVLAHTVRTPDQVKHVIDTMLAAVAFVIAVYGVEIATGVAGMYQGRPDVSWLNPNSATLAATLLGIMMTARYLGARTLQRPALTIGLGLFGAAIALVAGSKSSLGGGALALLLVVALVLFRSPTGFRMTRAMLMLGAVAIIVGYFVATDSGIIAHLDAYESNQFADPSSLTGRVPVWDAAITDTMSSPFTTILGHGYLSTFALGLQGKFWLAHQAHNSFVQTFFDLGAIGLTLVVILYAHTWFRVVRTVLILPVSDQRWVRALELLAALTVLTVVSVTEDIMGGVLEARSYIFLIVVFCINQNVAIHSEPEKILAPGDEPKAYSARPST